MNHLEEFYRLLQLANFCFADDSGKDWDTGHAHVRACARIATEAGWDEPTVRLHHAAVPSLVTATDIIRHMK